MVAKKIGVLRLGYVNYPPVYYSRGDRRPSVLGLAWSVLVESAPPTYHLEERFPTAFASHSSSIMLSCSVHATNCEQPSNNELCLNPFPTLINVLSRRCPKRDNRWDHDINVKNVHLKAVKKREEKKQMKKRQWESKKSSNPLLPPYQWKLMAEEQNSEQLHLNE